MGSTRLRSLRRTRRSDSVIPHTTVLLAFVVLLLLLRMAAPLDERAVAPRAAVTAERLTDRDSGDRQPRDDGGEGGRDEGRLASAETTDAGRSERARDRDGVLSLFGSGGFGG